MSKQQLSVYVAGASGEIARAKAFMATLRAAGIEVTSTWVEVIEQVGAANPMTAPLEERFAWVSKDLEEVAQARVLCLLLPATATTIGAWVELGFAIGLQMVEATRGLPMRKIMVVGEERSIFTAVADHHLDDDAAALHALTTLAALRGGHADG